MKFISVIRKGTDQHPNGSVLTTHFHPSYSDILTQLTSLLLVFSTPSQQRAEALIPSLLLLAWPHTCTNLMSQECKVHCRKWCAYIANKAVAPDMQLLGSAECWKEELPAAKIEGGPKQ